MGSDVDVNVAWKTLLSKRSGFQNKESPFRHTRRYTDPHRPRNRSRSFKILTSSITRRWRYLILFGSFHSCFSTTNVSCRSVCNTTPGSRSLFLSDIASVWTSPRQLPTDVTSTCQRVISFRPLWVEPHYTSCRVTSSLVSTGHLACKGRVPFLEWGFFRKNFLPLAICGSHLGAWSQNLPK